MAKFLLAIFAGFIVIFVAASILMSKPRQKALRIPTGASDYQPTEVPTTVIEPTYPVEITAASVVEATLQAFTNPNGEVFQEVIVTWKNTGTTTIRVVDANIISKDSSGGVLNEFNYTIYADFDSDVGLRPEDTYTTKPGKGFKLPRSSGRTAASVVVQIEKVSQKSGL